MVCPNPFHNDGLSNYPSNGYLNTANSYSSNSSNNSSYYLEQLPPPLQKPLHYSHHHNRDLNTANSYSSDSSNNSSHYLEQLPPPPQKPLHYSDSSNNSSHYLEQLPPPPQKPLHYHHHHNRDLNTANSYFSDSSNNSSHYLEQLPPPLQKPLHYSESSNNSSHYLEQLPPPPQKPLHYPHHHNGSSFTGTCFPSLLSPDLTVNDLSIPYADLPEQEWLSEFLYCCSNDYFWETCETMALAGFSAAQSDVSFTSKADQKLSRTASGKSRPKTEAYGGSSSGKGSVTRKCTHCAADDTPQWRSGPLGPKTLCNACGVRYKSGRLVPEYRPASSPTFKLSQHSNSHRKVLELRRQRQKKLMIKQKTIYE